jgi:hypothetical protein
LGPKEEGADTLDTELKRVSLRIAEAVLDFARQRAGSAFYMEQLNRHVADAVGTVAPDSPGRILRDLRKKQRLDYQVVSRSDSLYEFLS